MRLNTIADRLNERFVKPLALDRLCALIEAAMLAAQRGEEVQSSSPFARLQQEIEAYTTTPMGSGLGRRALLGCAAWKWKSIGPRRPRPHGGPAMAEDNFFPPFPLAASSVTRLQRPATARQQERPYTLASSKGASAGADTPLLPAPFPFDRYLFFRLRIVLIRPIRTMCGIG